MLISLEIQNFAIVNDLTIEWRAGMTAITGETGAGKSIAIDALSLCLGERADANAIRPGADKAQIVAQFNISKLDNAQCFLQKHMLNNDEQDCILRRVISKSGRSKSYINGVSVTASQLKELGEHLIAIHGQHAHQLLLRNDHQLQLIDAYAGHTDLQLSVKHHFSDYQKLQKEFANLQKEQQAQAAQKQLLEYQVAELDEFSLGENEFKQIEEEQNRLNHSQTIVQTCQQELMALYEQDGITVISQLQHSSQQFANLCNYDPAIGNIAQILADAVVQVEEASREIRDYANHIEQDPQRLFEVEERLSKAMELARKHQVQPELLYQHHQDLQQQLDNISSDSARLEALEGEIQNALELFNASAEKLSESRRCFAAELKELITASMADLAMENCLFDIEITSLNSGTPSSNGFDNIEFLVSTNPGQPLQALAKVASGGELSRISLAIQVIIADKVTTPTLIFDEVDVGISGPTASQVGRQLRLLGKSTQVICVTHLPQVACSGHQQFFVSKKVEDGETFTSMTPLEECKRVDEIARLIGGESITETVRASAHELLLSQAV